MRTWFLAVSMIQRRTSLARLLFCGLVLVLVCSLGVTAGLPVFRISVENTVAHVQTQSVQRFADLLSQRLAGRLEVLFYPAAALFRDFDVFRALSQGKLEMAVPGTWQFDKYIPEMGLFLLPSFYGRTADASYALRDSVLGEKLVATVEDGLGVKVLGRWIDLGFVHYFGRSSPISHIKDIQGKRIRVAGGVGNSLRIQALGGNPVTIAWPDFPQALLQKSVDGLLTSYETIASAALWQHGITHVYEDREYFAQYVPLVASAFWQRLPQDIRTVIADTWDECVDQARVQAAKAQENARQKLYSEGITIITPSRQELETTRSLLVEQENRIANQMGISDGLLEELYEFLRPYDAGQITALGADGL
jgi:TRAP-type C4-dicarboxylate transport system substrate-binding protein